MIYLFSVMLISSDMYVWRTRILFVVGQYIILCTYRERGASYMCARTQCVIMPGPEHFKWHLHLLTGEHPVDLPDALLHLLDPSQGLIHLLGGGVGDRNHDILGAFTEDHRFHYRLSLKTVQPVKEIYQHFQSLLLAGLDHFTHFRPLTCQFYVILELEVLPLERDGVVQEELGNVLENI